MERKEHWEEVYRTRPVTEVSWFQVQPEISLELIAAAGAGPEAPLIDVGGGASRLVDHLLEAGYRDVSVLDIAGAALERARERLGERAGEVTWLEADVTGFEPPRRYAVWHDRAVFHFLTDAADRARYRSVLEAALAPEGQVVIATFAEDGPTRCSNLEVVRYSPEALAEALGDGFRLRESRREAHATPGGAVQHFQYCRFERAG